MNPASFLVCLLATSMYSSVAAQRGGRGRQRDASHQMPPAGMQGPPPGMPQEQSKKIFNIIMHYTHQCFLSIYVESSAALMITCSF